MLNTALVTILASAIVTLSPLNSVSNTEQELSSHTINLKERVPGGGLMSDVMADNILLTLTYLNEEQVDSKNINWVEIRRPRTIEFKLKQGEAFAFHQDLLSEYEGKVVKTTNSRFSSDQGFKHDGYLMGDGVCHLASLINWASRDANLETNVPKNHDFIEIPGIDKSYGVSIYFMPGEKVANADKNLYILNSTNSELIFKFIVTESELEFKILETN